MNLTAYDPLSIAYLGSGAVSVVGASGKTIYRHMKLEVEDEFID